MVNKATLYPIYWLADGDPYEEPFDRSRLPFQIVDDVTIEDVSKMFDSATFKLFQTHLGRYDMEALRRVQYAIVHRYQMDGADRGISDRESETIVRSVAACLRLIRPMRQGASLIQGEIRQDGSIDVQHFEEPVNLLEVPEVQKLFCLRNCDTELLREVAADFLHAVRDEFWKFRMAVDFHEVGHFQDSYWKIRYLLWCSAMESIFTSNNREHQGSVVAKERIKWFLGAGTSIYDPRDIPYFVAQPNITVGDILDETYEVRNYVAHGDRIPDDYFTRMLRQGLDGALPVVVVLTEAVSFIIRKSLLRILQEGLLEHFASAQTAEAYFGAYGLTKTKIRKQLGRSSGAKLDHRSLL
jgi:hypothetical protein